MKSGVKWKGETIFTEHLIYIQYMKNLFEKTKKNMTRVWYIIAIILAILNIKCVHI